VAPSEALWSPAIRGRQTPPWAGEAEEAAAALADWLTAPYWPRISTLREAGAARFVAGVAGLGLAVRPAAAVRAAAPAPIGRVRGTYYAASLKQRLVPQTRDRRRGIGADLGKQARYGAICEHGNAHEQLVKNNPERPHICASVDVAGVARMLGRKIAECRRNRAPREHTSEFRTLDTRKLLSAFPRRKLQALTNQHRQPGQTRWGKWSSSRAESVRAVSW